MLSNRNTWRTRYEEAIHTLGVPATVTSTVDGTGVDCVVGWKTSRDEELINAFGIGVKVATICESDVNVVKKMDRLFVGPDRYTIDEVFPVYLNEMLVGWRCVIRGK